MNKKIKFNKSNLYKLVILTCVSIVLLTQCHMKKDADQNSNISSVIDDFENIDTYENELYDEQNQLKKQELQINNIIYYPLDQYNILPEFFYILDAHANFLCSNPLSQIKIEGHADERGTPEYNIALGERRANSIKLYLQSKGVLSKQIFIVSYGKEKPAVLGHNEEAYSKNRRGVLIYQ